MKSGGLQVDAAARKVFSDISNAPVASTPKSGGEVLANGDLTGFAKFKLIPGQGPAGLFRPRATPQDRVHLLAERLSVENPTSIDVQVLALVIAQIVPSISKGGSNG